VRFVLSTLLTEPPNCELHVFENAFCTTIRIACAPPLYDQLLECTDTIQSSACLCTLRLHKTKSVGVLKQRKETV
jgi:hypothetical protein